jgi:menaquinol-cytochrome c reductase cytochrome b/c subunit
VKEEQKQAYLEKYSQEKAKGGKFWPDIIFKDLIVSFAIFLLLVGLATFFGVAQEPRADPSDAEYIPRPEWYFLFLFEMLKFFPGKIEWVGTVVIPTLAILALFLLPFYDRSPLRHWKKRKFGIAFMSIVVIGMVALTIRAVVTTPPQEEEAPIASTITEQIVLGQDLYSVECVECHGAEGEGGEIVGVEGLEGVIVKAINSQDEMYTRTDETLFSIIDYGQPELGMPPSGRAYGGELSPDEIMAIVTFMRYTWDDRAEIPAEAVAASALPTLAADEVPSYDVHIQAIVKRYCVSCHRPGKENQNYLMRTYEEVIESGDNAPNFIAGDLGSNSIRMLHREEIEAGGPMPPTKPLREDYIKIFELWTLAGMPETAEQAAQLSPAGGEATQPPAEDATPATAETTLEVQETPTPQP